MSAVECSFPVFAEGPEPDVFLRLVPLGVPVVAPAALRGRQPWLPPPRPALGG